MTKSHALEDKYDEQAATEKAAIQEAKNEPEKTNVDKLPNPTG